MLNRSGGLVAESYGINNNNTAHLALKMLRQLVSTDHEFERFVFFHAEY